MSIEAGEVHTYDRDERIVVGPLVVGRKRDGRCTYDPLAKQALVGECLKPGVSVARVAMLYGTNANLLRTWIAKSGQPNPHHGKARSVSGKACALRDGWRLYARRAGVEGTLSQGVRAFGLRRTHYRDWSKQACSTWSQPSP